MKKFFLLAGVCILLSSCSTPDSVNAVRMLGSSSRAVLYLGYRAVSEDVIEFEFSESVEVKNLSFTPHLEVSSIENGATVQVRLEGSVEPGALIKVDLLAEDERNNSIHVITSLRTKNNRMPQLVINEICTEKGSGNNINRAEFIEFRLNSDGNLGGMRVVINGNTNASRETVYEFLPCEVKRGEYVVLHLRTLEDSCRDEYGSNLALSGGANAKPTARDFWVPGSSKLMHKEATAIYVLYQDDRVLAALMISDKNDSSWDKDYFAEAAQMLFSQGAWKSPDGQISTPATAARSAGTTNTRTICRDETVENTNTAADWYVAATSSATPGELNNPKRYQQ